MDAMLDWGTEGSGQHYDSRVVRSCRPYMSESTDPGGDGYWQEPADWGGAEMGGIQKGWGYVINDTTLNFVAWERMPDAGSGNLYPNAPATGAQGWARVRTRYQDGSVKSCNPLPVTSPDGSGGCA